MVALPALPAEDATADHVLMYVTGEVRRVLAARPVSRNMIELLICGVGFRYYDRRRNLGLMKVRLVD